MDGVYRGVVLAVLTEREKGKDKATKEHDEKVLRGVTRSLGPRSLTQPPGPSSLHCLPSALPPFLSSLSPVFFKLQNVKYCSHWSKSQEQTSFFLSNSLNSRCLLCVRTTYGTGEKHFSWAQPAERLCYQIWGREGWSLTLLL